MHFSIWFTHKLRQADGIQPDEKAVAFAHAQAQNTWKTPFSLLCCFSLMLLLLFPNERMERQFVKATEMPYVCNYKMVTSNYNNRIMPCPISITRFVTHTTTDALVDCTRSLCGTTNEGPYCVWLLAALCCWIKWIKCYLPKKRTSTLPLPTVCSCMRWADLFSS